MSQTILIASLLSVSAMSASANPDSEGPPKPKAGHALMEQVAEAKTAGDFAKAEQMLKRGLRGPGGAIIEQHQIELEILRRTRLDYRLTAEQMLANIQKDIRDVSAEDLERWRAEGVLQYRNIDGCVWYFNREPVNLYRFSDEARGRRDQHREKPKAPRESKSGFVLVDHLARLVEIGEASDNPQICPVRHRVRYSLSVNDGHPLVRKGAKVRCWLPFPKEYRQQTGVRLISAGPVTPVIAPNETPQRTIYFERTIDDPSKPVEFFAEFDFTTSAYYPKLDPDKVKPYKTQSAPYRDNTQERPPHIAFTPEIKRTVEQIVGDETNPLLVAKRIFHWVCRNIRYCAEMEYSTIPNLSAKALETRRGDCGVQGMLFITMCRCAGIPARWQSGWETKPDAWNMHDWAEIYVEPWGWLPVDPSYGLQDHPDPKVHGFYFGHLDPYRMIVNLDYARSLHPPKASFRSEPNDFQRGEIGIDGKNLYYDEWDWTFEVRTEPINDAAASPKPTPDDLGRAYVPSTFKLHDGKIDWVVHFHGGFDVVKRAAEEASLTAAVVSVSRPGLSSVYEKPFSDPSLFGRVLQNAVAELKAAGTVGQDTASGRVYVSSFSAGFGAVRAILKTPEYFEMIDGIVLADSLYAGYAGPIEQRRVNPENMTDFRRFAAEAAAGGKFMLVTHCELEPGRYASTAETADDLIRFVGGRRKMQSSVAPGSMRRKTRVDVGDFHVLGYAGTEGEDHVTHLRNLWAWYTLLPVSTHDGTWKRAVVPRIADD